MAAFLPLADRRVLPNGPTERLRLSQPTHATLNRKSPLPVWAAIAWRAAFAVGLVVLAVLVHWMEREGLRDHADGHVSFIKIYWEMAYSPTVAFDPPAGYDYQWSGN